MQEMQARSLGWDDPLEQEMATNSSILAWKSPLMKEPGGLQSVRSKESDRTEQFHLGTKSKGHRVEYNTLFQSLYSLMHGCLLNRFNSV